MKKSVRLIFKVKEVGQLLHLVLEVQFVEVRWEDSDVDQFKMEFMVQAF
jgi:hypothetical protein